MSAAESKAVVLSYASQDAEAARRIAEALPPPLVELRRTGRAGHLSEVMR